MLQKKRAGPNHPPGPRGSGPHATTGHHQPQITIPLKSKHLPNFIFQKITSNTNPRPLAQVQAHRWRGLGA